MTASRAALRRKGKRRLKRVRKKALHEWRSSRREAWLDAVFFNRLRREILKAGRICPSWENGEIPLYGHIRLAILDDLTGDPKINPTRNLIIRHLLKYRRIPKLVRRALEKHPKLYDYRRSLQYDLINYIHYLRACSEIPDFAPLYERLHSCSARHRCGVIICPVCKLELRDRFFKRILKKSKVLDPTNLRFVTIFFGISQCEIASIQKLQDSGIRRIRNIIDKYVAKGLTHFRSIWFSGMIEVDFIPHAVIRNGGWRHGIYGGPKVAHLWWRLFSDLGKTPGFSGSAALVTYHAIAYIPDAKKVRRKFVTWPKKKYGGDVRLAELDAQQNNRPFFPVPYQVRFQKLRENQETSDALDLIVTYMSKMNASQTDLIPDLGWSEPKKKPPMKGRRSIFLKGMKVKYTTPLGDSDMHQRLQIIEKMKFQNLKREVYFGRLR